MRLDPVTRARLKEKVDKAKRAKVKRVSRLERPYYKPRKR